MIWKTAIAETPRLLEEVANQVITTGTLCHFCGQAVQKLSLLGVGKRFHRSFDLGECAHVFNLESKAAYGKEREPKPPPVHSLHVSV
jgi:hypothetical protein